MSLECPNIYEYLDPILYLNDSFEYKKALNPHFSQRVFASKAGIKSPGFICEVLKGRRKLTPLQVENFITGLKLNSTEADFFKVMVQYSQATNFDARKVLRTQLLALQPSSMKRLNKSLYKYYSKWYHIAVRESLCLRDFKGEFESFASQLAKMIQPQIKKSEALDSLKLLREKNLIEINSSGYWKSKHASLVAGSEELGKTYLRDFQTQMIDLSKNALENVDPNSRNISCTTMSVSENGMKQIAQRIKDFHSEIVQLVQLDKDEDRLYQFNVQFFPLGGENESH